MKNLNLKIISVLLVLGINLNFAKADTVHCNELAMLEMTTAGAILDYSISADKDLLDYEKNQLSEISKSLRESSRENALRSANFTSEKCKTNKKTIEDAVKSLNEAIRTDDRALEAFFDVMKLARVNGLWSYKATDNSF